MNHKKLPFVDACTLRLSMGWVKIGKVAAADHSWHIITSRAPGGAKNKQEKKNHRKFRPDFLLLIMNQDFLCNFTVFQINHQLIGGCMLLIVIARQLFFNRFSPLLEIHILSVSSNFLAFLAILGTIKSIQSCPTALVPTEKWEQIPTSIFCKLSVKLQFSAGQHFGTQITLHDET